MEMALNSQAWAYRSVATLIESGGIVGGLIRLHGALVIAENAISALRRSEDNAPDTWGELIRYHKNHSEEIQGLLERHGIPPDADGGYRTTGDDEPGAILSLETDNLAPEPAVKEIEQAVCDAYAAALSADGLPVVDRETLLLQRSGLRRIWAKI